MPTTARVPYLQDKDALYVTLDEHGRLQARWRDEEVNLRAEELMVALGGERPDWWEPLRRVGTMLSKGPTVSWDRYAHYLNRSTYERWKMVQWSFAQDSARTPDWVWWAYVLDPHPKVRDAWQYCLPDTSPEAVPLREALKTEVIFGDVGLLPKLSRKFGPYDSLICEIRAESAEVARKFPLDKLGEWHSRRMR